LNILKIALDKNFFLNITDDIKDFKLKLYTNTYVLQKPNKKYIELDDSLTLGDFLDKHFKKIGLLYDYSYDNLYIYENILFITWYNYIIQELEITSDFSFDIVNINENSYLHIFSSDFNLYKIVPSYKNTNVLDFKFEFLKRTKDIF
jgi:hypothetical protein